MEVEEISVNVISDYASALSSLTGGSATADCLEDMKPYGLYSCNENLLIIFDSDEQFFACSQPIALDNLELTNLHGYIARVSSAKHICYLCQAEIGTVTSKLIIKTIKKNITICKFLQGGKRRAVARTES